MPQIEIAEALHITVSTIPDWVYDFQELDRTKTPINLNDFTGEAGFFYQDEWLSIPVSFPATSPEWEEPGGIIRLTLEDVAQYEWGSYDYFIRLKPPLEQAYIWARGLITFPKELGIVLP